MKISYSLAAVLVSFSGIAVSDGLAAEPLAVAIESLTSAAEYRTASWGILVADLKTGQSVYELNAEKLFVPASVTKLFSGAAALVALGPDYRFETPLYFRGGIRQDGALVGDLILRASGDPSFGARDSRDGRLAFANHDHTYANSGLTEAELHPGNPLLAIDHLARLVRRAGIRQILGDVLIDDRMFLPFQATGSGPELVSPIMVNDNLVDLIVEPGPRPGTPARYQLRPVTQYFQIDFDVTTSEAVSSTVLTLQAQGEHRISVRGQIPLRSRPLLRILPVDNPRHYARTLLIESLRRHGVRVEASLFRSSNEPLPQPQDYAELPRLGSYRSPPFSEFLKVTLKVSHNLYASALPALIGCQEGGISLEDGLRKQRELLRGLGVDVKSISFGGGAGGAISDYVTPRETVRLLLGIAQRPEWPIFREAMPKIGVDGTLVGMLPIGSPAYAKIAAKTGTLVSPDLLNKRWLLRSKALAGVMTTATGREVAFAIFMNTVPLPIGVGTDREGKLLAAIAEQIYCFAPPATVGGSSEPATGETPGQSRRP